MKSEYLEACKKAAKTVSPICEGCKLWHGCKVAISRAPLNIIGDCFVYANLFFGKEKNDFDQIKQAVSCMSGEMIKECLGIEERTDIKAIMLDELEHRGEYEKPQEAMRL